MESILEYHIRNIKERTGIEFSVIEGSTWENPSLRYHVAKELFHSNEDKEGIATIEDCFKGIEIQKETLEAKIKKIPQNVIQSVAIANLQKGDLDDSVNTWLGDLRKAKEKDEIVFESVSELGYLLTLHGRLSVLMNEMTNKDVADNVNQYRQTLKNNIKTCHNLVNMDRGEWLLRTWLDTLCGVTETYKKILESTLGRQ
nr:MAG TPA: hypothetical protein [Caudoviricetes sp.]